MKLHELQLSQYISNPFRSSLEQRVLFHGTKARFVKFRRPPHGIYVTPFESWAMVHYGPHVIPLYANVTKRYKPSEREIDLFYNVEYAEISDLLRRLSKRGFNCIVFGGESESMVLFNNIELVSAVDGKPL